MQNTHTSFGLLLTRWYIVQRPAEITRAYTEYARAFSSMFSIIFLLKTLFAPWKSIRDSYPTKGFDVSAILQTLTLNITARAIGCIIRLAALIFGICLQLALFAGFALYIFLWVIFPVLALFALPFIIYVSF